MSKKKAEKSRKTQHSVKKAAPPKARAAAKRGEAEELDEGQLEQVSGGAAVDYFLKIEGIKGESIQSKHGGTIELESFSWGATPYNTGIKR